MRVQVLAVAVLLALLTGACDDNGTEPSAGARLVVAQFNANATDEDLEKALDQVIDADDAASVRSARAKGILGATKDFEGRRLCVELSNDAPKGVDVTLAQQLERLSEVEDVEVVGATAETRC